MLLTIPFLRNSLDFVFDSEVILQASYFGLRIEEVPAPCRYFEDMSSVGFKASIGLRAEDAVGVLASGPAPLGDLEVGEVLATRTRPESQPDRW